MLFLQKAKDLNSNPLLDYLMEATSIPPLGACIGQKNLMQSWKMQAENTFEDEQKT